jgi:ketol-acid reductoisomerase
MKEKDKNHPVEVVGKHLRRLMSWIKAKEVD